MARIDLVYPLLCSLEMAEKGEWEEMGLVTVVCS